MQVYIQIHYHAATNENRLTYINFIGFKKGGFCLYNLLYLTGCTNIAGNTRQTKDYFPRLGTHVPKADDMNEHFIFRLGMCDLRSLTIQNFVFENFQNLVINSSSLHLSMVITRAATGRVKGLHQGPPLHNFAIRIESFITIKNCSK